MSIFIIIITAIVSILALSNRELFSKLQFTPYDIKQFGQWYRFFTYGLIHADWMHMMVNLFVLYSFGEIVEQYYGFFFPEKGWYYFLLLYFGGIISSTIFSYIRHKDDKYYRAVGASGAVSGVLFAAIIFNPAGKIGFLFLPFGMPSVVFGVLYLIYSVYMSKRGNDNIGHDAHFWGAIFGIVFTIALKPSLFIRFLELSKAIFVS